MEELLKTLAEHFGYAGRSGTRRWRMASFSWLDKELSDEAKAALAREL